MSDMSLQYAAAQAIRNYPPCHTLREAQARAVLEDAIRDYTNHFELWYQAHIKREGINDKLGVDHR